MRLYLATNTISIAVAIALEEAGLDYEPVPVSFKTAEQTKASYLSINPKARVPALELDEAILTETGAILEYIAAIAPAARLVPSDPLLAAHMRSVMYYLGTTMHVNHAHGLRGIRWADQPSSHQDMAQKVPQTMRASAQLMEDTGLKGDFVTGETLSLADPYLFMVCSWLKGDKVETSDFPKITAFLDRMNARPSVIAQRERGFLRL